MNPFLFRVGEGWDTHALVPDRPLIIGGVHLPFHLGLQGHSDADVLLHAVTDAVLGAAGLGDIGEHFPDTDPRFKGVNSMALLMEINQRVKAKGFVVVNVDCTVIAEAPRLKDHKTAMAANIAAALGVSPDFVNVKAKTAEKLGPVGEGKSIEARAVAFLGPWLG